VFCSKRAKGERLEPMEVTVDVDDPYTGIVIDRFRAQGRDEDMRPTAPKTQIIFRRRRGDRLSRRILTDTRGTGVMNHMFRLCKHKGPIRAHSGVSHLHRRRRAVAYALWYLEERGKLFIVPGTKVIRA
jgi:GTP-binding protein